MQHSSPPFELFSEAFGLPSLVLKEAVARGILSNNSIVTDGKHDYFLKQWRIEKPGRLKEILAAERYFADKGIPVITPLPTADQQLIITHQATHYSLYPFVAGLHVERPDLDGVALDNLAIMLARLHQAGDKASVSVRHMKGRADEKARQTMLTIRKLIEDLPEKSPFDEMALEYLNLKLSLMERHPLDLEALDRSCTTLIHGDYHESNVFFDAGHQVTHVFDFEKTEMAPRSLELIRCVKMTLIEGNYSERNMDRAARFISAYSKVYPIQPDEVREGLRIWFSLDLRRSWIEEEHYLNNNTRPDVFLESRLAALNYESENLDRLGEMLTATL